MLQAIGRTTDGVARRVLVVDDNAELRRGLSALLHGLGFEVDLASDGSQAADLLVDQTYDAVICDVLMPVMTGPELFTACRERRPQMLSHFVFLTGSVAEWETARFLNETGQPCLGKPFRIAQLCEGIEAVMDAA